MNEPRKVDDLRLLEVIADMILEAEDAERERCARIAEDVYGDQVAALGGRVLGDEPKEVGRKIAAAIRAGGSRTDE